MRCSRTAAIRFLAAALILPAMQGCVAVVAAVAAVGYVQYDRNQFEQELDLPFETAWTGVLDAFDRLGYPEERIEEIGAVTVDLARRFPDMARLRLQAVVVAGQDPKIRDIVHATIDRLHAAHRGLIEAAIADGSLPPTVDSEILAHAIAALANQLYVALVLEHPMIEVAGRALPTLLAMIDDPD